MSINVKRTATILKPDQTRVLLRPFNPGDVERTGRIFSRIMSLPEEQVGPLVDEVSAEFSQRHGISARSFCGDLNRSASCYRSMERSPSSGGY